MVLLRIVRSVFCCTFIMIMMVACQLPRRITPQQPTPSSPVASLTPFQPESSETPLATPAHVGTALPATATSAKTPTPKVTTTATLTRVFATLEITPALTQTPSPVDVVPQPTGQVNILFFGADHRQGQNYHTDVILLVTLRPDRSVSLTSFPRDLYVYMPGRQMQRLSAAMQMGGFDLIQTTFDYNFGFRPDYYLLTDLSDFPKIIDTMGGVDVQVAKTFHGAWPGNYPQGYTVQAGTVHMDGSTALWYSNAQSFADDVNRMRRSQEVLIAMGKKLFSLNALTRLPEIYNLFRNNVDTDLSLGQVIKLLPQMLAADPKKVTQYSLGSDQTTPWIEPISGAQVLIPRPDAIKKVIHQAIGIP